MNVFLLAWHREQLCPWGLSVTCRELRSTRETLTADLDKDLAPWISFKPIQSYLSGHLTQKYLFLKGTPHVWLEVVMGEGALHPVTQFGVPRDCNSWQIYSTPGPQDVAKVQTGRKDGCCNSPSPLRQLSGFCMAIGHKCQEEAPPHSCWPILPALSGAPDLPHIGHAGEITHRLVRLVCFISELFFTLYNI